jgi:methionyl aminopeptidase
MTLAIETNCQWDPNIPELSRDRWTVVTMDNALSAQFEHTVLVTATGYENLNRSQ